MDVVTLHRRTVEVFLERVDAIGDGQWGDPTPCADWNVRELVNHVVGEDRWTAPLLGGSTVAEVGDRFDGDLLGADPVGSATDAAAEAVAAVGHHVPTGGTVQLSYGEEHMAEYVHQLAADHLVHAWDVAAATGGDRSLDTELVDAVADWFAGREEMYRNAGIIGERVGTGDDDDATARLVGAFGRDPGWG